MINPPLSTPAPSTPPIAASTVKVAVKDLNKYIKGASLDDDVYNQMEDAILNGRKFINVSQKKLQEMERNLTAHNQWKKNWARLCEMKSKARSHEQSGQLQEAFGAYKDLITFAVSAQGLKRNNYDHDINRFRIVCNKLKKKEEYEHLINSFGLK